MAPVDREKQLTFADVVQAAQAFEEQNPELSKELDILGMEVDEYARVLASSEPQITTSNSTA